MRANPTPEGYAAAIVNASGIVPPTAREVPQDELPRFAATAAVAYAELTKDQLTMKAARRLARFCLSSETTLDLPEGVALDSPEDLRLSLSIVASGMRRMQNRGRGTSTIRPPDLREEVRKVYLETGVDFPDIRSQQPPRKVKPRGKKDRLSLLQAPWIKERFGVSRWQLADAIQIGPKPDWDRRANCRVGDPEDFFDGRSKVQQGLVSRVCQTCPVRQDCLTRALLSGEDKHGVWGATEHDRAEFTKAIAEHDPPTFHGWADGVLDERASEQAREQVRPGAEPTSMTVELPE